MSEDLDKIAQRMGGWSKFKEKLNLSRKLNESLSDSYGNQMEALRDADDAIRALALEGTSANPQSVKEDLKAAKQAVKERRYLDVVHFIGNINNKIGLMAKQVKELESDRDVDIDDFYGASESFDSTRDYFQIGEVQQKAAGIFDYFSDRARAARHLEKVYKNTLKKRYEDMQKLVNHADILINRMMDTLKVLGGHRASGNISDYIRDANELEKSRVIFHTGVFKKTYDLHIAGMVSRMAEEKAEEDRVSMEEMMPQLEVQEEPAVQEAPAPTESREKQLPATPETPAPTGEVPTEGFSLLPPGKTEVVEIPLAEESQEKAAYIIMNIIKAGIDQGRSKEFMSDMFMDYADGLEKSGHPERSMQCIAVAEGLLNEW